MPAGKKTTMSGGPEVQVEEARTAVLRWSDVLDGLSRHVGPSAHPALRDHLMKRYRQALEVLEKAFVDEEARVA
jgi:hypothetical protein